MDFHGSTLDSLRSKGFHVEAPYLQAGEQPCSAHLFVAINGIPVPIEAARELDAGKLSLEDLATT